MRDLRTIAKQVVEEWHTDYGSVRMASLMMALEATLAEPIIEPKIKNDNKVDSQGIAKQPSPPLEAQTEAEKIAYCAGWWAAMEEKRS
jgi:hypothetical protein